MTKKSNLIREAFKEIRNIGDDKAAQKILYDKAIKNLTNLIISEESVNQSLSQIKWDNLSGSSYDNLKNKINSGAELEPSDLTLLTKITPANESIKKLLENPSLKATMNEGNALGTFLGLTSILKNENKCTEFKESYAFWESVKDHCQGFNCEHQNDIDYRCTIESTSIPLPIAANQIENLEQISNKVPTRKELRTGNNSNELTRVVDLQKEKNEFVKKLYLQHLLIAGQNYIQTSSLNQVIDQSFIKNMLAEKKSSDNLSSEFKINSISEKDKVWLTTALLKYADQNNLSNKKNVLLNSQAHIIATTCSYLSENGYDFEDVHKDYFNQLSNSESNFSCNDPESPSGTVTKCKQEIQKFYNDKKVNQQALLINLGAMEGFGSLIYNRAFSDLSANNGKKYDPSYGENFYKNRLEIPNSTQKNLEKKHDDLKKYFDLYVPERINPDICKDLIEAQKPGLSVDNSYNRILNYLNSEGFHLLSEKTKIINAAISQQKEGIKFHLEGLNLSVFNLDNKKNLAFNKILSNQNINQDESNIIFQEILPELMNYNPRAVAETIMSNEASYLMPWLCDSINSSQKVLDAKKSIKNVAQGALIVGGLAMFGAFALPFISSSAFAITAGASLNSAPALAASLGMTAIDVASTQSNKNEGKKSFEKKYYESVMNNQLGEEKIRSELNTYSEEADQSMVMAYLGVAGSGVDVVQLASIIGRSIPVAKTVMKVSKGTSHYDFFPEHLKYKALAERPRSEENVVDELFNEKFKFLEKQKVKIKKEDFERAKSIIVKCLNQNVHCSEVEKLKKILYELEDSNHLQDYADLFSTLGQRLSLTKNEFDKDLVFQKFIKEIDSSNLECS